VTVAAEFTVAGMHCASCGLLVDETLEGLSGVDRCATDVRRGRTVVVYDPARVTTAAIAAAIVDAGYDTEPPRLDGKG
jgi:copper chaperone